MKYMKQLSLILAISFAGEILHSLLPLPIPASIYGMVLLFAGLQSRLIRLEWVKETGNFLVEIMPVMFIPICVGLMDSWNMISPIWFPVLFITCVTVVIVMTITGRTAQAILRGGQNKKASGCSPSNPNPTRTESGASSNSKHTGGPQ